MVSCVRLLSCAWAARPPSEFSRWKIGWVHLDATDGLERLPCSLSDDTDPAIWSFSPRSANSMALIRFLSPR